MPAQNRRRRRFGFYLSGSQQYGRLNGSQTGIDSY